MHRPPWSLACSSLAAAALAVGASACAGEAREAGEPDEQRIAPPVAQTETAPRGPTPAAVALGPEVVVRVLDGDTSKPVEGARVVAAGEAARADSTGTARLALGPRKALKVRVAAPGYAARTVKVDARAPRASKVAIWRRATQWHMYGANPARTQAHGSIRLRPPFRKVWHRHIQHLIEFPAVVWEGVAYVNTMRGWTRAISMKNGRVLWKTRVGTKMASSPGIDPDRRLLVVTTMSPGRVAIIDMDTGKIRWRFTSGTSEPSPLVRDGVAYFGATNGNVYALDLDRKRTRWVFRGGVKITGSPALTGNRLIFGDYAGRVFALNVRNGRRIWTGSAGSRVYGTAAVSGGRVFVPSVFSGLSALSARTGRLLWRVPVDSYLYSSPAVYRGRVYYGTHGGSVYSVDARSGRLLWRRPAGGRVSGAVMVAAGLVYASGLEGSIRAWSWRTGRQVWSFGDGLYVPLSGNGERLLLHGRRDLWAVEPRRQR